MEEHDASTLAPVGQRSRRLRVGLVAGGIAVGIALAGLGVASAQTNTPDRPPTIEAPAEAVPVPLPPPFEAPIFGDPRFVGPARFKFGHHGFGFGLGGIHSEVTMPKPEGDGFRTIASQVGEVTKVSESSIELKSEDGFTRTYSVTEDTLVNAGRDGIGSVKTGDSVRLMAIVEGDTARALHITDETNLRRLGEQWRPKRKGR